MVSRKPVPSSQDNAAEASAPSNSPDVSGGHIRHAIGRAKPPYPIDEGDSQMDNPWQDVQRPSEISEGWEDANLNTHEGGLPASLTISHPLPLPGKTSDLPDQIHSGLPQLTPQSSWEKDSVPSSEHSPVRVASEAPTNLPPAAPIQAPPPPPTNNNPFRARSTERLPEVSKEEDSSNIWEELAKDNRTSTSQYVPLAELDGLGLEDKSGWESESNHVMNPEVKMDSPLMEFNHGDDYKQELEATPFGPAVGLEDLGHGKGKGKAIPIEEEDFEPPQGPPPSKDSLGYTDRKITVPEEVANKQRSETYQIKHIRWADSSSHEIRTSPILTQNKNGPCPLLALVNALTLSTPSDAHTALVETLRVREQISLGLLLDAVFDELMSGRRGDAAQELPDVSELYAFLITLHTGMNVNPRFMPAKRQEESLMDGSFQEVPLNVNDYLKPGSFEATKEMMLYGTFSIPLIHGWLPPRSHPASNALERSAASYEDAQNLMFREEELEDKVQSLGLTPQEQQLLEDISSIKFFLSSTATQLTGHGLQNINETLRPGSIAILFRNDHFSTLYKQPRTGQILLLVTDAGYSSHDEIVWESLSDVSGEGSEFFSGDFRPVGGNPAQSQAFDPSATDSSDWTTVSRNKGRNKQVPDQLEQQLPEAGGRDHEQEDADLALALQLQEEEEENSRRNAEQRRRQEEEASNQYLSRNGGAAVANASPAPHRPSGSSGGSSQNIQPLLPPRRPTGPTNSRPAVTRLAEDDAPPSYEAAAKVEPYLGPDQSQSPSANNNGSGTSRPPASPNSARPRGQSAYSVNSAQGAYMGSSVNSRRQSGGHGTHDPNVGVTRRRNSGNQDRDKDCMVM